MKARPLAVEYEPICEAPSKDKDFTRPQRPPRVTMNVYLFNAKKENLQGFCDQYLNSLNLPDGIHFELLGSYVYLVVMSYGDEKVVGEPSPQEVAFSFPVKWYEKGEHGDKTLVDWALVSPFVFAERKTDAIIDRELNGRPTMDGKLRRITPSKRERELGANPRSSTLTVETEVLPDLDLTQPAKSRMLLTIRQADEQPAENKRDPALFKDGIKNLMLKQFRDAEEPDRACYQALVQFRWVIKRDSLSRILGSEVQIQEHATLPIVKLLGLQEPREEDQGGERVKVADLQPFLAVSMELEMEAEARETICWRAGTGDWERSLEAKEKLTGNKSMQQIEGIEDPYGVIEGLFRTVQQAA